MVNPRISFERLIAYATGNLPAREAADVEAAMAADPEAARTVARYRLAQTRRAADDSVTPTPAAVARARAVFNHAARPIRAGWLDAMDRFIAHLIYDSRLQPLAVRYAGAEKHISLTFETDSAEIDLQAQRLPVEGGDADAPGQADRWQFMGQISPASEEGGVEVAITQCGAGTPLALTSADQHGTFVLELSPGKYDLHIKLPRGAAVLPGIDIA